MHARMALTVAGLSAFAAVAASQTPLPQSTTGARFEVVSVKENVGADLSIRFEPDSPDGYRRINVPLGSYVSYAFDIRQNSRLIGLPGWTSSARYDIVGKAAGPISDAERRAMVRDVLATRFRLRTHVESREQTVLVMTPARADRQLGPGLVLRTDCTSTCGSGTGRPDGLELRGVTLTQLADGMLSNLQRQVVRDETGIPGTFDVKMSWRPDSATQDPADTRPSFFTAMQEQLGLKLEPQRRLIDVLIVDGIERPTSD